MARRKNPLGCRHRGHLRDRLPLGLTILLLIGPGLTLPGFAAAQGVLADHLPEFVPVPPGTFRMGSPYGDPIVRKEEQPAHEVTLTRPFLIARVEVTRELWRAVMNEDPGYFADCVGCPVENVTWYRAIEFCNALSDSLGLEAAYRREGDLVIWNLEADGFRLPTEAEWECACRAGTTTRFHSGDCLTTDQANFNGYEPLGGCPTGLDRAQPLPVGSFPPNTWELFDMHGNVSEWCWDATGGYPSGPVIDPTGPGDGPQRCFRGGSWFSQDWHCRSAARFFVAPTNRYDFVGLRLARSLQLDRK